MTKCTKNSWTLYVQFPLVGISTTLVLLLLMFIQTTVVNFDRFTFQATIAGLKGDCIYGFGSCTRLTAMFSCTGLFDCFYGINAVFRNYATSTVGVQPMFVGNATTIADIVDIIYNDKSYFVAFVLLIAQQPLGWVCLLVYILNWYNSRTVAGTIFVLTRSFGFIASLINTHAATRDLRSTIQHPSSMLSTFNDILPIIAFIIMLIEVFTVITLMVHQNSDNELTEEELGSL